MVEPSDLPLLDFKLGTDNFHNGRNFRVNRNSFFLGLNLVSSCNQHSIEKGFGMMTMPGVWFDGVILAF